MPIIGDRPPDFGYGWHHPDSCGAGFFRFGRATAFTGMGSHDLHGTAIHAGPMVVGDDSGFGHSDGFHGI